MYHGSSGGLAWWAVGIFWHGGLAWWDVFLGIFDVDRCIRGSNRRFSGRFWAFFWVFSEYHGFFWVFSGLIGIFSPPIRWPRFQIGGESVAWVVGLVAVVGSNWFVCGSVCVVVADRCVWLY